ncbi:hypothetical protein ACFV6Z_17140 [Streptomyces sp. NPDC059818]|uniref:hypothetical protein n=1 Tax=Streptomyces sp. NPDC059818 TaxID=3346962 RepID=UPI003659E979
MLGSEGHRDGVDRTAAGGCAEAGTPGPLRERVYEAMLEAGAARLAAADSGTAGIAGTAPRSPAGAAPGPGPSTAR